MVNLHYGTAIPQSPQLTVIVMSVDSDLKAVDALASIDTTGIEKILVNTGSGSLGDYINQDDVLLIESPQKQYPGGTRNIGILHSTAPIISFLAADCLISPGSLEKRIEAHRRGFALVSSSLRPSSDAWASWACYIYLHRHRMPEHCRGSGSSFGLSYNRNLFQKYGLFDETMRVAEDAAFNQLCNKEPSYISRDILTFHKYPETLRDAMRDISQRAIREAKHRKRSGLRQARSEAFKSVKLFFIASLSPKMPWKARRASIMLPILGMAASVKCIWETRSLSEHKRMHK